MKIHQLLLAFLIGEACARKLSGENNLMPNGILEQASPGQIKVNPRRGEINFVKTESQSWRRGPVRGLFAKARLLRKLNRLPEDQEWNQDALLESRQYFEGDIKHPNLNSDNFQSFVEASNAAFDGVPGDVNKNAIRNPLLYWPNAQVPFEIGPEYGNDAVLKIIAAMDEIEEKTCIRFKDRTSEDNYIRIRPVSGCFSSVGMVRGRQVVSLSNGCFIHGIIVHELIHALGFFHEQSRADRDNYIKILWSNISPGTGSNFAKKNLKVISHLGESYDYGSLMHYGTHAFSRNGNPTISAPDGVSIGQRIRLSRIDVNKLNKLYKCDETVTARPKPTPIPKPTSIVGTKATPPRPWRRTPRPWTHTPRPWTRTPRPWTRTPRPWRPTPRPWIRTPRPWRRTPRPWTARPIVTPQPRRPRPKQPRGQRPPPRGQRGSRNRGRRPPSGGQRSHGSGRRGGGHGGRGRGRRH